MKPLTAQTAALLAAPQQEIFHLIEIEWAASGLRRYAQRAITLDSAPHEPRLAAIEEFSTALGGGPLAPWRQRDALTIRLCDEPDGAGEPLALLLERNGAAGHSLRLYAVPRDRDAAAPALADRALLQAFITARAEIRPGSVLLHAIGLREALDARPLCRMITRADFPGATPDALGRPAPVLFGALRRVPLTPWRVGEPRALAADVSAADDVIPLTDINGLPPAGAAQIGAEIISYSILDAAARTLGSPATPVHRPAPAAHAADAAVWIVPPGGFVFLLADHPCRAVGTIYADDLPLGAGSYSIISPDAGGRAVTAIALPRLPVERAISESIRSLRINNTRVPGSLAIAPGSLALYEPLAIDADGDATAAHLTRLFPLLAVNIRPDWRDGASRFGALRGVTARIDYVTKGHWTGSVLGVVRAEWGGAAVEIPLPIVPLEIREEALPAHAHAIPAAQAVFPAEAGPQAAAAIVTVSFDSAEGERDYGDGTFAWPDARRVMDGSLDAAAPSFAGEGRAQDFTPLRLRRLRPFFGPGQRLARLFFKARVASPDASPRQVLLAAYVEGAHLGGSQSEVTNIPAVAAWEIPVSSLTAAALASPETIFQISEMNGAKILAHEAWLEAHLEPSPAAAALATEPPHETAPSPDAVIIVPFRGTVEISLDALLPRDAADDFSATGWAIFNPADPPRVSVELRAPDGIEAFIHVFNVEAEVEYAPLRRERVIANALFADVEGLTDSETGALIENPADVIAWLIRDGRALGLPDSAIDAPSFGSTRAALAARGYRFAAMIRGGDAIGAILDRVAWEARAILHFTGERFTLRLAERWTPGNAAPALLDDSLILRGGRSLEIAAGEGIAALDVAFGPAPESGNRRFDGALRVGAAGAIQNALARRVALLWHPAAAAVRDWAGLTLSRASDEPRRARVQAPLAALAHDPADAVTLTDAALSLAAAPGALAAMRLASLAQVALDVALDPALDVCLRHDDETFIAHLPGRFEMIIVLAGRLAAALDAQGHLRLRGEAREGAFPPSGGVGPHEWTDWPLVWDAARELLIFGYGAAAPFTPAFALDADGNLLLPGQLEEFAPAPEPPSPAPARCVAPAAQALYLLPGGPSSMPALWFDAGDSALRLRASAEEHHPLA